MPKYKGIVISDVHVGAMDIEKLHNEYNEIFINKIKQMKTLDFVIIAGDFFDRKFYLSDKESTMAYIMLKEVLLACKEKNAVLRIVYGTESHECNQYDILSLLKIYDKIEVIKTVKDEELLPGLNILYLPEEHILDKHEYYSDFFNKRKYYNYIFGHGVVREVMKNIAVHVDNNTGKNKTKRKKVPVFNSAELLEICKGQVYFGHYHINEEYDNKIFSISSFSRWKFGEEGRKGFYILKCDTDKDKYEQTFIENTIADSYKTISFGFKNEMFENETSLKESLDGIDAMIKREPYKHMRFIFNIPTDIENPESAINYIKERYKQNEYTKIDITNGYIEQKRKQDKEKIENDNEKYSFIEDPNIKLSDKISKFIEIVYEKTIPNKNIDLYLYNTLSEILDNVENINNLTLNN